MQTFFSAPIWNNGFSYQKSLSEYMVKTLCFRKNPAEV